MFDAIVIIRGTLWWGAALVGLAMIISAAGGAIAPLAVLCGVLYAVVGVKFYGVAVSALFGTPGGVIRFAVWFPVKLLAIVGSLFLLGRSSTAEILSGVLGAFAFLPAGFHYAFRESQGERSEETDQGDPSTPPPSLSEPPPTSPAEDR